MQRLYLTLSILVLAALLMGCAGGTPAVPTQPPETAESKNIPKPISLNPPANCPVTKQLDPPFVAPEPYYPQAPYENYFWYGSEELWTMLPVNGVWAALPHNPEGYTQKIFWWRDGYVWNEEPLPELIITGERLDGKAPSFRVTDATNAYANDIGSAMLTGVDFPTIGCWKVTGQYGDAALSFVIWIEP